jgi:addiction module RelE/StbE family toxin
MRVEWSDHAVADLTAISEFIERDRSLETANRVVRTIYDAVQSLTAMPRRGRLGRVGHTRELSIPRLPWMVIYRVLEDRLTVLNIVHGARLWP